MSDEQAAFLAAIRENPADDTVRLVYADWLQENGQEERAEFIRVQIEIERCEAMGRFAESYLLHRREYELWREEVGERKWTKGWADSWPIVLKAGKPATTRGLHQRETILEKAEGILTRGFISHITCTAADWLAHGDAITREHPVERVTLTGPGGSGLVLGRYLLWRIADGVNEWKAIITYPDEGYGMERWPGVIFTLRD